jgi:hypothetical protein
MSNINIKKISIISVVRNDNYGLYQAERTTSFLKSLNEIPNKDSYELIFVEWNPINGELSFYEKYKEYFPLGVDIKIVNVSEQAHKSIYNPYNLPVFEYYGKNVGARFSDSDFLIFTNPDNIFFSQTWIDIEKNISEEYFMRLCRSDVKLVNSDIIYNTSGIETIKELMKNHYHFYQVPGYHLNEAESYEKMTEGFIWGINHEGASGDFFGVSKQNYNKIKGYREYWTYGGFDGIICRDCKSIGLKQFILPKYSVHIDHSRPHLSTTISTDLNLQNYNTEDWGLNNIGGVSVTNYYIKNK